jgi:methyl-accepting chemotaxis protein
MLVICEKCGLKYKINPSKIKGETAWLTCKVCAHVITINKSELIQRPLTAVAPGNTDIADRDGSQALPDGTDVKVDFSTRKKRSRLGLTGKVVIMLLLVSLLPGIAYFVLSSYNNRQSLRDETRRMGELTVGYLTQQVNEWVVRNIRLVTLTAGLPEMTSMDRASQELIMRDVQRQYPWIYLLHVIDLNGMDVARSDDGPLMDYSMRKYAKDIKEGKDISFENVLGLTSKKPGLMVAAPIKKEGRTVGGLVFAISFDQLSRIVIDWRRGQVGAVFIADQEGKIMVHRNEQFIKEQKNFSAHPLVIAAQKKVTGLVEYKGFNNEDILGFAGTTELGWTIGLEENRNEAYFALNKIQVACLILFGATVLGTIVAAYFSSRAIVMPICRLIEAADRFSVGELSVQITRTSQDEIGDLADAMSRMQESIRLSIERLRRKTH